MATESPPRHEVHLPRPLTPLVGRERQVAEVVGLLGHDDGRLVTLIGPGGVGKTRLAIAVAANAAELFPDGTWFVDLAPLSDPALLLPTTARALGLRTDAAVDGIAALVARRRCLIVLDNMEQIVEGAPSLLPLLESAPGLTVLVTSRVRLRVTGEQLYPVPPLDLPEVGTSLSSTQQSAAVELFTRRARAVQPAFRLGPTSAFQVAEICRRLDGLPLAIELAAARTSMFSPTALLSRLDSHLAVLTDGARDLPARQRTMRATIGWSYALLSADQQTLLRRLAAYVGGFSLEAAEAVGAIEPAVSDGPSALLGLIEQSLVRTLEPTAEEPRFGLLETVREFSLECLEAAGELQATRAALVDWVLSLGEQAARGMDDYPTQARWGAILDAELENLRTAVAAMAESGRHVDIVRLIGGTQEYWSQRTHHVQVLAWLDTSLRSDTGGDPIARVWAHHLASISAGRCGRPDVAIDHGRQAVRIARSTGDPLLTGIALFTLAVSWQFADHPAEALPLYREAIPFLRLAKAAIWVGLTLSEIGDKMVLAGDAQGAIPVLDEALAVLREQSYRWGLAFALGHSGFAEHAVGRPSPAADRFGESFRLSAELGDDRLRQGAASGLAMVLKDLGRLEEAATLLGAVEASRAASGVIRPVYVLHHGGLPELIVAELGQEAFDGAFEEGRGCPLDRLVEEAVRLADAPPARRTGPARSGAELLTAREEDVLRLVVAGRTDREIADELFVSPRTVNSHVSNLLGRLEVSNRAEAAAVAVRRGLV